MKKKVWLIITTVLVLTLFVSIAAVCVEMNRNKQGILTYEKSITRADGEVVDYYLDKDGNRYSYNAAGELVGTKPANKNVTENNASTQSKRLNEEQLIAMAKKFAAETFGKEYVDLLNETTLTHLKSKDRYVVTLSYVYDGISIERCDVTLKPDGTLYNVGTINKGKYDGIDIKKLADVDMEAYVSEQLGGKERAPKHEINTIWLGKNAEGKQCLIADVTVWEYSEIFGEVRDKYREIYYFLE